MMNDILVYKSNMLVEASYRLSLQEQRLILSCIAKVDPQKDIPKTITLTAAEFYLNFPDIGRQHAEEELKKTVNKLWDRSIVLKNNEGIKKFRWIQEEATYHKGEARISITFSDSVIEYLTHLKSQFTKFHLKNVSKLSKPYSIRLYELLIQFIAKGHRVLMLDEFKRILQIEDKYKDFKNLNKFIIKPSLLDLNEKTNLSVSVNFIRKGNNVIGLHFDFKEKLSNESNKSEPVNGKEKKNSLCRKTLEMFPETELEICPSTNRSSTF